MSLNSQLKVDRDLRARSDGARRSPSTWTIRSAHDEDRSAIATLLREADLPDEDFAAHLARFVVARDEAGVVIGAVGAEVGGRDALLRSLVVAPAHRGHGLGRRLVEAIEQAAAGWGVQRWWLLTTTAEKFFAARGFVTIPRGQAPAAIRGTAEFREPCPSVAVCMSRGWASSSAMNAARNPAAPADFFMATTTPQKVLILCTGNSARSVLGEYLIRHYGRGRFEVHSAGSKPTGRVNPFAVRVLKENYNLDASAARSKSMDEFRDTKFDFVITVCDNAKESCPIWRGAPVTVHWSSPDPAGVEGSDEDKLRAFQQVGAQIARRAELFCALPEEKLRDPATVQAIGNEAKLANESEMRR